MPESESPSAPETEFPSSPETEFPSALESEVDPSPNQFQYLFGFEQVYRMPFDSRNGYLGELYEAGKKFKFKSLILFDHEKVEGSEFPIHSTMENGLLEWHFTVPFFIYHSLGRL